MNKLILETILKQLLSFEINHDIDFNKSLNSLSSAGKKGVDIMYDFINCNYGDQVYYDDQYGYNLLDGEYIGYCVIEAGQLDNKPRFVYKEDIGEYNWETALNKCKEIKNGYLPSKDELSIAYNNGLKNDLIETTYYWTSSQYDNTFVFSIDSGNGNHFYDKKPEFDFVRPFIKIPQLENKLSESVNLLNMDNDEIDFKKSPSISINGRIKDAINKSVYENIEIGDPLFIHNGKFFVHKDPSHTLYWICKNKGIPGIVLDIGVCVATANDMPDGRPRFRYVDPYHSSWLQCRWGNICEIPELYNTNLQSYQFLGTYKDYNGWENTLVLLKYDILSATTCKNEKIVKCGCNVWAYLPSIHELGIAKENNMFLLCDIWSSTISNKNLAHYLIADEQRIVLSVDEKDKNHNIFPFIYVDYKKNMWTNDELKQIGII